MRNKLMVIAAFSVVLVATSQAALIWTGAADSDVTNDAKNLNH